MEEQPQTPSAHSDRFVGTHDLAAWDTRAGRRLVGSVRAGARLLGPRTALLLTLVTGLGVVVALTALSSAVYDAVTGATGVAALDQPALDAAKALRTPELNAAVTFFTNIGGAVWMPVVTIAALAVITWLWRRWTPILLLTIAAVGAILMTNTGKAVVGRNRPPLTDAVPPYEYSASFPSGHSMSAMVIAGAVAYLLILWQRGTWSRALTIGACLLFALAMGLSRVFLGHHWLTDVLVAWTLGLAWLAVVITMHRLFVTMRRAPPFHEALRHRSPGREILR